MRNGGGMRSGLDRGTWIWRLSAGVLAFGVGCGRAADATSLGSAGSPYDGPDAGRPSDAGASTACGPDGVLRGDFTVRTQAELDGWRGCQRLEGSLTVRVPADADTTPLSTLHTITGRLTVLGEEQPAPRVLDGFRGLEVAGEITLSGLTLADLSGFSTLRQLVAADGSEVAVGEDAPKGGLRITTSQGLTSLAGLDALEQATVLELYHNRDLKSLSGMPRLWGLKYVFSSGCPLTDLNGIETSSLERVDITDSQITSLWGLGAPIALQMLSLSQNQRLTQLTGWQPGPRLEVLSLNGNMALENLRGLEPLREVGSLDLGSGALVSLTGLEGLESAGSVSIHEQSRLQNLTGLAGLREAGGIVISLNPALTDLAGLSSLTTVGSMALNLNLALTSLAGLGAVTIERFEVGDAALSDLRGFERATIARELVLGRLEHLESLDGLALLTPEATLVISGSPALDNLAALAALSELKGLALLGTGVTQLDLLANLRRLGSLQLDENRQLEQIDALGSLESLGSLRSAGNPLLRALPGFEAATASCAGCGAFSLSVIDNAALERVGPWPWLDAASSVYIGDNPALTSVALPELRSAEEVVIINNASLAELRLPGLIQAGRLLIDGNPAIEAAIRDCATGVGSYRDCPSP